MSGTCDVLMGMVQSPGIQQRKGNNIGYGLLQCQNHQIARPSPYEPPQYDPRFPKHPPNTTHQPRCDHAGKRDGSRALAHGLIPPPSTPLCPTCTWQTWSPRGAEAASCAPPCTCSRSVTCRPWGQPQKLTSGWQSEPSQDSTGPPWAEGSWLAPWRCGSSRAARPRRCCPACRPSC